MSLLRPRIQNVYCGFVPVLMPGSLVLSPSGMTLLVLQGCPQHKPLQGFSPHLLRQDCSPSVCPRHLPKGSLTGFTPGKGNTAAFEGLEGTSSYLCRVLAYLPFKTPCKGNHLKSCAVYFTYINSLHDHNSDIDSGVPALTPSISPGKMSHSAESHAMNNMAYRRRENEGQLLETSGPL